MELMERPIIDIYARVKFPSMRQRVVITLQTLADRPYQLREWIMPTRNDTFWYDVKHCIEALEDTVNLPDTSVEEQIDYVLVDYNEANIIKPVIQTLDAIYEQIGPEQPDLAYINSPLWDDVVKEAQAAFKVFIANEKKAHALNPHPWQGEEDWPNVKV